MSDAGKLLQRMEEAFGPEPRKRPTWGGTPPIAPESTETHGCFHTPRMPSKREILKAAAMLGIASIPALIAFLKSQHSKPVEGEFPNELRRQGRDLETGMSSFQGVLRQQGRDPNTGMPI